MNIEQFLWYKLEEARIAKAQVDELPKDTPMLAAIIALSNQAVIEACQSWMKHVTR